jgi:hypothetical protein
MAELDLARKLLAELRRMPNATPTEALAAFRRRLVELGLANGKARPRGSMRRVGRRQSPI